MGTKKASLRSTSKVLGPVAARLQPSDGSAADAPPGAASGCDEMSLGTALPMRQWRAVQLIAQGLSRADVAKALSVDVATVSRWRGSRTFSGALEERLRLQAQVADESMRALVLVAVERLSKILLHGDDHAALKAISITMGHPRKNAQPEPLPDKMLALSDRLFEEAISDMSK